MKVSELIAELSEFEPEVEVVVMSSNDEGDNVTDWNIVSLTDGWWRNKAHDMVSIKIDFDQRPEFFK